MNLYTYVINNLLRYFDPSGNQHIDIGSNLDAYRSDQIKMLYLRWQLGDDSWMKTVSDDVGEQVWNMAKSDWTLEDAFKWFSAGVLTGAVLANPSAGFAALEVATTGTYTYGTVAITGGVTLAVAKLTNSKTVTTIPGLNAIAQKSLDVKRSITGIIRNDGTVEAVL
ncbi:hypothetical protein [Paenibacillus sp. L3-i20]|uniref:hypothetical protein n=1 Tax=Paenibacillus sp. L3-i20 TaxID=2905833 RepID=UPI001EE00A49|nr:hypothetical protein [Paenibacillus sp. L3-i20]GKU75965.1 hypothetical protein L3i20_v203620 [Paenibacillus sp. L3-i20]